MTQIPQPATPASKARRAVQANALHDRVMPRRGSQGDTVLNIVTQAKAGGRPDLTRREIGQLWEERDRAMQLPGRRDASLVARVVNELCERQALVAKADRVCTVTGLTVGTVGLADA